MIRTEFPLAAKAEKNISLPFIYKLGNFEIVIKKFDEAERKEFFFLENLEKTIFKSNAPHDLTSALEKRNSILACVQGNLKLEINTSDDNLWFVDNNIGFLTKVFFGIGIPWSKTYFESGVGYPIYLSDEFFKIDDSTINDLKLNKFSFGLRKLNDNLEFSDAKLDIISNFMRLLSLDESMHIRTSFSVAILDSLFNAGGSYKLATRITKLRKGDFKYFNFISEAYKYRNKLFHGDNPNNLEKLIKMQNGPPCDFLAKEVIWALSEYITSPEKFSEEELNRLVLG